MNSFVLMFRALQLGRSGGSASFLVGARIAPLQTLKPFRVLLYLLALSGENRRLPDLMETVADDALSLAEGTATGLGAAGEALWGLTRNVAAWASDLVLRQALAPVHEYRTSARRVQAALDEEQAALPDARPQQPRSSAEEGALVKCA